MKVLIVDDSRTAREITAAHLQAAGHDVILAADGEAALALHRDERPDLVLLDVEMPGMDGYALASQIRRIDGPGHWIPILFLSARVADADLVRGLESGGDDYITKPVSSTVLRAKLAAMDRITSMRRRLVDLGRQLEAANRTLLRLSALDGLTQIPNRRTFDQTLATQWARCAKLQRPLAVILLDVDEFKRYNDTYGHQSGDDCLIAVARQLQGALTSEAMLAARYGGEEFGLILPETPLPEAIRIGEQVLERIRDCALPHASSSVSEHVTVSLGLSLAIPGERSKPQDLLRCADTALYSAKREGRNRLCFQPLGTETTA